MTRTSLFRLAAAAVVTTVASAAHAHTGGDHVHGLTDGLIHPITGADHLLAMVAVGLIAARVGGRSALAAPAAFLSAMVAGFGAGLVGLSLPLPEAWIALTLIVLGAVVALARPVPVAMGATLAAVAGLAHGYVHSLEGPTAAPALAFAVGVLVASTALHALGFAAARHLSDRILPAATGAAALLIGAIGLSGAF